MTTLAQAISNTTYTWNGDVTHISSEDALVDLFYFIGASRIASSELIAAKVNAALAQDVYGTGRILLWARDCRGGAGERRVFHEAVLSMPLEHAIGMIGMLPMLGYWKDVIKYVEHDATRPTAITMIRNALQAGEGETGLVAKYLPRKGKIAAIIRNELGMTPKQYRKTIVSLSNTVEQKVCAKEHSKIDYSTVPSKAMNRHYKSFLNHDAERFGDFLTKAASGESNINSAQLYPYEIVAKCPSTYYRGAYGSAADKDLLNAQWSNLPDYIGNSKERIISVVDTSGSMMCSSGAKGITCMDVAVSLGLYTAYNAKGAFNNKMITFSAAPHFINIRGKDIVEDTRTVRRADWGMNTNLDAVYQLILDAAVSNQVPESEMPTLIAIVSDMQFDYCADSRNTAMQRIKAAYIAAGYKVPKLVFWNVNGTGYGVPATKSAVDVGLVSGFSPSIFKSILSAEDFTPRGILDKTVLNNSRYAYRPGVAA